MIIDSPILMDTATASIEGIEIVDGGKLVFDANATELLRLTTGSVIIRNGGRMDIGSSDCPFEAQAEIVLTGKLTLYSIFRLANRF